MWYTKPGFIRTFLPRILKIKLRGSNIMEPGSIILEPPHVPDWVSPFWGLFWRCCQISSYGSQNTVISWLTELNISEEKNGSNRSFQKHNWTWFSDLFDLKMLSWDLTCQVCNGSCALVVCAMQQRALKPSFFKVLFSSSFCGFDFTFIFNFFEGFIFSFIFNFFYFL